MSPRGQAERYAGNLPGGDVVHPSHIEPTPPEPAVRWRWESDGATWATAVAAAVQIGDAAMGMEERRPVEANRAGEYRPRYIAAPGSGWGKRRRIEEASVVAGGSPPMEPGGDYGGWERNWPRSPSHSDAEKQPGVEASGGGSCWVARCRTWTDDGYCLRASVEATAAGPVDQRTHWQRAHGGSTTVARGKGHAGSPAHGRSRDVSPAQPAY